MKLIELTSDLHEVGPLDLSVDFEVGTEGENDFEAVVTQAIGGLYIPGTEWGGLVEYTSEASDAGHLTVRGWTWRGLLTQIIIEPPAGEDYLTVSGDANAILTEILSDKLGGFFNVPETASINISSYQFNRYVTALDGLSAMLASVDYRLSIHADKVASGQPIQVTVEAVPSATVRGFFNEDSAVPLTYTVDSMGINHLICLGKGELRDRTRVDLYMDAAGKVSQVQTITGLAERTAVYDYSSADDAAVLAADGEKRLRELASSKKLGIQAGDTLDLEVGDKVRGIFPNGSSVTSPIVTKILQHSGGVEAVEYKVKGDRG